MILTYFFEAVRVARVVLPAAVPGQARALVVEATPHLVFRPHLARGVLLCYTSIQKITLEGVHMGIESLVLLAAVIRGVIIQALGTIHGGIAPECGTHRHSWCTKTIKVNNTDF